MRGVWFGAWRLIRCRPRAEFTGNCGPRGETSELRRVRVRSPSCVGVASTRSERLPVTVAASRGLCVFDGRGRTFEPQKCPESAGVRSVCHGSVSTWLVSVACCITITCRAVQSQCQPGGGACQRSQAGTETASGRHSENIIVQRMNMN